MWSEETILCRRKGRIDRMKLSVIMRVLLAGSIVFAAAVLQTAYAVPAWPGTIEVSQPDGTRFLLRLRGDEFFSWNETDAGYAVVQDVSDRYWKYAQPARDKASFDMLPEARVGTVDPESIGLQSGALPAPEVIREHFKSIRRNWRSEAKVASSAPVPLPISGKEESGPQPPPYRIPVSGTKTIRNIVILACFNDHWNSGAGTVNSSYGRTNTTEYNNLFNQVGHTEDGAVGSVRDYFTEVSYGKLTVESIITPWVRLPQNEAYYGANDIHGNDVNPQQMVVDAINAADAAGFDFSQGDFDGDGWVDCLTIIHSGHAEEYTGNSSNCIWSHQGSMASVVTKDLVSMMRYHTAAALRDSHASTSIIRIGVICHEMGHFFGLPDLYDYSNLTHGIGSWGIMAYGSWNGSDGKSPAHFSAWSKHMLGFIQPVQMHSKSSISIPRVEDNPVVHLYRDGMSNGEYYLVENRVKTGFDNAPEIFPGILIYHIDNNSFNNDLGSWAHPVVKIEEADGNNSLGLSTAYSQAGDAWSSASGLSGGFRDQTGNQSTNAMRYQPSHYYNRSDNSAYYSYNRFNTFSSTGNTMTYTASTLKPTVESQTVSTSGYTVTWSACTNATQYEIQEGTPVTLTSFFDGAESEDAMYDNWHVSGTVTRDNGGSRTGSYSYAMHQYYGGKWYSSVQCLTMRQPFKVTASTVFSFYLISHLSSGNGYLKCEISNDNGNTWATLDTLAGYRAPWELRNYNYSALNAVGISANDICIIRFVVNFERVFGWAAFPGYGYALDDISITNTEISSYGNWSTLSSSVSGTSHPISGKSAGVYPYRVRAYANSVWQDYGAVGVTSVTGASYTVSFSTDGTLGATLSGATAQVVPSGGNCTPVTANEPASHSFVQWTLSGAPYSISNPLTVMNVTSNMALVAQYTLNTYVVSYSAGMGGTIMGPSPQIIPFGGSGLPVHALEDVGYHFVDWNDGSIQNPRIDINVIANASYTANFAINLYEVTFDLDGKGTRTGGGDLLQTVGHGDAAIEPVVTAEPGWVFTGWDVPFDHITGYLTVTALYIAEGEGEGEGEDPVGFHVNAVGDTYFLRSVGDAVTFTVHAVNAEGDLTYQWYKMTAEKALTPVGLDLSSHTIDPINEGDFGSYQCHVYDASLAETAESPVFTLALSRNLPAAGILGLLVAAVLTGLAGAAVSRKRK